MSENTKYTHIIDWDLVVDVKDVVEILKGLNITIDPKTCSPKLLPYLIVVNPKGTELTIKE
jgi:hypothetical protein